MNPLIKQPSTVYLATFLASLVLSLVVYLQNDIINKDGVLYMNVARAYVDGGIGEAFVTFNWPFYGIAIGLMHQLTQLGYENSAYLLNALLISLACVAFVATYREVNRDGTRIWIAALLILALPILNEYRDYVIRGFGYWAFLLIAVLGVVVLPITSGDTAFRVARLILAARGSWSMTSGWTRPGLRRCRPTTCRAGWAATPVTSRRVERALMSGSEPCLIMP